MQWRTKLKREKDQLERASCLLSLHLSVSSLCLLEQSVSVPLIILLFLTSLHLTLTDKYSFLSSAEGLNLIFTFCSDEAPRSSTTEQNEPRLRFGTNAVYIYTSVKVFHSIFNSDWLHLKLTQLTTATTNSQTSCLINLCATAVRLGFNSGYRPSAAG